MEYISVKEIAKKWDLSERSVRNYCAIGRVPGAILNGKTWFIPIGTKKPIRLNKQSTLQHYLLDTLRIEKESKLSGGIYHKIQIYLTYNSNHIEGNQLSEEQTRYIFETNTIGFENNSSKVDDIVETVNHFRCIDMIIDNAHKPLSQFFIKDLHKRLKSSTSDETKDWIAIGDYKKIPNEVGGNDTASPEDVVSMMTELLFTYNAIKHKTIEDIINFHVQFERIHPFQDGNGRVGRLIMFKECLKHNIVPFIIEDSKRMFYYRGLKEWDNDNTYLIDTCLAAQDRFKEFLDYFRIKY